MEKFKEIKPTKYLIVLNIGYVTAEEGPEVLTEFYAKSKSALTLKFAEFLGENFEDIYFYCLDKGHRDAEIQLIEVRDEVNGVTNPLFGYPVSI